MEDLKVEIPFSRIVEIARYMGSQDRDLCPPVEQECWLKRGLQPYLPQPDAQSQAEHECTECWLAYWLGTGQ